MGGALVISLAKFVRQLHEQINRLLYMDGTLVIFFKPAVWLAVYSVADALWKTVMSMDGMLANFLTELSHLLCTVQPVHDKKQPFTETELSPNFRCAFLARWVLCGRFASQKCDLHGRNSRHFFLRPLLVCFCGSTLHGVHVTYCYDFSSKRFHFRFILRSFWGPKRSHGPIPSFWDQSGINLGSIWHPGGPHVQNSTIWGHPFLDPFWTNFRQVYVFA